MICPMTRWSCAVGGMGAPTVSNEKLQAGNEIQSAVRALEGHLRKEIHAIVIGEIGGGNALGPMVAALQLGLPVVDGDGMGRAFPELQMDTFMIEGVAPAPFVLADSHGNVAIFTRIGSAKQAEDFARSLTIEMGGSAALVMPVMTGAELKATIIRGTLSLAKRIGETVLDCRARSSEPAETVAALCNGKVLFKGKIIDVERRTEGGFARGKLIISAFSPQHPPKASAGTSGIAQLELDFQNENLIARSKGSVLCTVPRPAHARHARRRRAHRHGVPALWLARGRARHARAQRAQDAGSAGGGWSARLRLRCGFPSAAGGFVVSA